MNLMPNLECANSGRAMTRLTRCSSVVRSCARPSRPQHANRIAVKQIAIGRLAFIVLCNTPRKQFFFIDSSRLRADLTHCAPCPQNTATNRKFLNEFPFDEVAKSRRLRHLNGSFCGDLDCRLDDVFTPITLARGA